MMTEKYVETYNVVKSVQTAAAVTWREVQFE